MRVTKINRRFDADPIPRKPANRPRTVAVPARQRHPIRMRDLQNGGGHAPSCAMLLRRTLLLSAAAFAPLSLTARAAPGVSFSAQDQADIGRIETYLNSLTSLKARFMQVAPDGGVSQGTAWLVRPGRLRFQYASPSPFLLVAAHGRLIFHDSALGQTSNIALSRTPLGVLLEEHVHLSGAVTVTAL